ncbi:E3 ubiquitin-protein ligase TRIM39-like isoform X3 [Erpetoichthys calabaricus]|uniref:E3 ubiquitin-protein ligase TRIM39-like isoform X3 n=1 Tax=Erpetoichthys calabaricus TaxID=27687 RepID=UPI002234B931|nr:E3 ubiquitin-protein ligase TRIM39-like isoform X3 [Erpetoichthys calabaricus]
MTPKDYLLKLPESFTVTSIISALFKCVRSTITCTLSIPGKCVRLPESFTVTSIISALFKCVRSTITCTLSIPGKCVRELNHYNQDAEEILRRYNAEGYIVQREWNEMLTCQDIETVDRSRVNNDLHVSEDNKMISFQAKCPGGRVEWPCALAKELESGKHCWILEVGEKSSWAVGVASETILKKMSIPDSCKEGYWYIKLFKGKRFQAFSSSMTDLSQNPKKIAVYLDFDKSELLFVDLETQITIHKFKEQFSEKLYPLFSPGIHDKGPLILQSVSQKDVKETLGRHTSLLLQLLFDVREILGKYISLLRQRLNDVKETLWIFFSLLLHPQNDVREILGKYISLFRQRPNASLLLQLLFDVREILGKYISLLYQRQNDIETVDRNTAHGDLHVSEDNKRISFQGNVKCPGGRAEWPCALAKELESGKHCWILEVGEKSSWAVGVASETILKNLSIPDSCKEGYWYIKLFKRKKFQAFSSSTTDLSQKPRKIAVYLDFDMGELSFVDVEKHVVIHRFKEQFSDKLYPVFSPGIHDKGPLILHSIPQNKTN